MVSGRHEDRGEEAGRIMVRVDPELLELIPEFLANRRADLARVARALEAGDWEVVGDAGHRLLGVGGFFGFQAVSALGARLEQAAQRRDRAAVEAARRELEDYLARVEVES